MYKVAQLSKFVTLPNGSKTQLGEFGAIARRKTKNCNC